MQTLFITPKMYLKSYKTNNGHTVKQINQSHFIN